MRALKFLLNLMMPGFSSCHSMPHSMRGSMQVLVILAAIPLIGFTGVAIDSARGYFVKAKLSRAIDAAGLAGGRSVFADTLQADIEKYFYANFPAGYMNATVEGPMFELDSESEILTISASATLPTTFMSVFGQEDMRVSAQAVIQRSVRGMELALIMDNTGSMRSGGKMNDMKQASQTLINILYGENEEIPNFWVSLIPYTTAVNVGGHRTAWTSNHDPADFAPTAWKGCVEALHEGGDVTDTPPPLQLWPVFSYPNDVDNVWPPVREENSWQNEGTGPNLGCGPELTPLTAEKSIIQDAIDEMQPWHRGGTMTNVGMAWGWRTLSPRWRGLWGGDTPATLPLDYDEPLMDKVAVILTDGENQFFDYQGGGPDGSDYGAYGRRGWERLGTSAAGAATAEANSRLLEVCDEMKDNGIIVYTITFALSDTSTQSLYRQCATTPSNYFNSPDGDTLQSVFEEIGARLSNLRLIQ